MQTKNDNYTLSELKDQLIGPKGNPEREAYEYELRMDLIGKMIQKARKNQKMTQEELGRKIGVQKAQISKIESSASSASIDTLIRVFNALHVEITFKVKLENNYLSL